jgi:hygromycin-B 4-O-kinase
MAFWAPWHPAFAGLDFVSAAVGHAARVGRHEEDVEARIRAYFLHIGLDNLAYCASIGRWDHLADTSRRMTAVTGIE